MSAAQKNHSSGVIGNLNPIQLTNEKHSSNNPYGSWRNKIFEATSSGNGNIELGYASPTKYEHPNNNTTIAHYSLKAGIYNGAGDRSLRSHNINWENVTSVSGKTYDVKDYLKDKGLSWDRDSKSYVKKILR